MNTLSELTRQTFPKASASTPTDQSISSDERVYECDYCQDMKMITRDVPVDHPDFGKAFPCPQCHAPKVAAARQEKMFARAGIPDSHRRLTFESFDAMPEQAKAGKYIARYAVQHIVDQLHNMPGSDLVTRERRAFPLNALMGIEAYAYEAGLIKAQYPHYDDRKPRTGAILYGFNGWGKTGLMAAAANYALEFDIPVLMVSVRNLLQSIKDAIDGRNNTRPSDVIKEAIDAPLLLADEFGLNDRGFSTYDVEVLTEITRGRAAILRPTIYSTNLHKDELEERAGPQIVSIVTEHSHWINLAGMNLRNESYPPPMIDF